PLGRRSNGLRLARGKQRKKTLDLPMALCLKPEARFHAMIRGGQVTKKKKLLLPKTMLRQSIFDGMDHDTRNADNPVFHTESSAFFQEDSFRLREVNTLLTSRV
ncbi:hypothetical protein, partial [Exiguobacterium sp. s133]|uniref:hypothetical protein n=1 Tax=Exiguobacterium sp. s133 TaxID=2751213 RepID=UPI001BE6C231